MGGSELELLGMWKDNSCVHVSQVCWQINTDAQYTGV